MMNPEEEDDTVVHLDRIRRYRNEMSRRKMGYHLYRISKALLEVSTVTAVLGRGLQLMSRELGYDYPRRRIRFPD